MSKLVRGAEQEPARQTTSSAGQKGNRLGDMCCYEAAASYLSSYMTARLLSKCAVCFILVGELQ